MTNSSDSDTLTPHELSEWLSQEIADVNKARDLRTKQATDFVESYHRGELSPEQAAQALFNYDMRWGEALPGVHATPGAPDEDILKAIDETRNQKSYIARARRSNQSGKEVF